MEKGLAGWKEYPEYDRINARINAKQREIDENGKMIDLLVSHGKVNETYVWEERHQQLCNEMEKLVAERHKIAEEVFA